ncbi:MAG TPA: MraY family glycosyltransferase [Polyangia bacterium]|jgi:UDP-GlcNAc:undecaprenyl-phosphate GlcNAc-1-phosphate transferase|nr:MraY family glycosyltransferase [Polyangia bacterium]
MRTAAVAFILSIVCASILTPLVRRLAHRFGALDHAWSSRKIHSRPIPRLGGVAIVVAFYVPLVALLLFHSDVGRMFVAERNYVVGLFVGGLAIALLGVYDDLKGAGAGRKFLVQFAVAGFMYWIGYRVDTIANPFGLELHLGWASLPFTLLWIVGVINALNLIDGLDGLAGGVALVAVLTTFLISLQRAHPLMMLFSGALAGSILGFLFYNFNPATIFMGDTGSMFLGFILATSAIQTNQKSSTAVAVMIPGIALGLPIMDTLLAMGRRALRGRSMFQADKEHIHHRLLAQGLSHRQTVLVLYGFCVLLGAVALVLTYTNSLQSAILLVVVGALVVVALRALGYMRLDRIADSASDRRKNKALRAAARPLGPRLRQTASLDEVWIVVADAASVFGARSLRLGPVPEFVHEIEGTGTNEGEPFEFRFALPGSASTLELGWRDGRREIDRDTEIAVDLFCEHLAEALERLKSLKSSPRSATRPAPS